MELECEEEYTFCSLKGSQTEEKPGISDSDVRNATEVYRSCISLVGKTTNLAQVCSISGGYLPEMNNDKRKTAQ